MNLPSAQREPHLPGIAAGVDRYPGERKVALGESLQHRVEVGADVRQRWPGRCASQLTGARCIFAGMTETEPSLLRAIDRLESEVGSCEWDRDHNADLLTCPAMG